MKDEIQWWEMYRYGDQQSFRKIFDRYQHLLYNYGYKFTKEDYLIDESIQELFVKLWCKRESIGETLSVKNYLLKSFRRLLVLKLQHKNRFLSIDAYIDENIPFDIQLPHDVEIIRKERLDEIRRQLKDALSKMTPRQREIVHLRYFEELSYDEISEVMGLSLRDTYKLSYRAMDSLRKYMSKFQLLVLFAAVSHFRA